DTAGIRETTDAIEAIGVQRAKEKIATAKILLYLYDEWDATPEEVIGFVKEFWRKDLKVILLHNKIDLSESVENEFDQMLSNALIPEFTTTIIPISAKDQTGIETLKKELSSYVENLKTDENTVITNQRHFEALQKSLQSFLNVKTSPTLMLHTEMLANYLRYALKH